MVGRDIVGVMVVVGTRLAMDSSTGSTGIVSSLLQALLVLSSTILYRRAIQASSMVVASSMDHYQAMVLSNPISILRLPIPRAWSLTLNPTSGRGFSSD